LDLSVSVGVYYLGQVLHQPEVGTHGVCQTSKLTELWNESNFVTGLPVLVDKEWLIWIVDGLVVPGLVVLLIADLSPVLVERGLRTHTVVDTLNSVSLLIVPKID